ncbi:MAG: hypothetical protein H8E66_23215 [Planctomycetes bacterium]|nr:hypothetical protein [Planctomycetota bacterium]
MSTNGRSSNRQQAIDVVETLNVDAIERLIARTRRLLRSTWTTIGLAITCGVFVSALLFVTVVDLAMPLSTFLRVAGWLAVVSSGAVAFIAGVLVPILRRLSAVKVAHKIESHLPGIHNRLVSCVELTDHSEAAKRSPVFHRRLVIEAIDRIRGFQPTKVLNLLLLKRAAIFAGCGLIAFAAAAVIFGDRMPTAVARIVNPLADIPPNSGVKYDVLVADNRKPGNCDILRGEDVKFTVVLRDGEVDPPGGIDPLRLELNVSEEDGGRRRVWYDFGQLREDHVSLTLNEMQYPCSYRVHGGGTWSKQYAIKLLDRPRITSVHSAVHFPEYMRIDQPKLSSDDTVDITGPVGSHVEVSVSFEGDVSDGEIELLARSADGEFTVVETVAMQSSRHAPSDEHKYSGPLAPRAGRADHSESDGYRQASFDLKQDGHYRIVLQNSLGHTNRHMKEGKLTAVPDNAPQVVLARPTKDIVVTSPMEIPVQVAAFDDFGLDGISLVVEHNYWGVSRQAHPLATALPPRNEDALFVLDLAEQRLRANDRIECHVEARDTKGQVAISESFIVRVANEREAADRELAELQEQLKAVEAMLESLVREQNRADEIIGDLARADSSAHGETADREEPQHETNPFGDESQVDRTNDDIWERDEERTELARLERQNAHLAEQLAHALERAAEQAAEAQLLPTEIAEQIEAAEQAIEPLVQQPLEQLEQMASQMAQPEANREQAATVERVSDHLQDNLADLQARLEAIQRAQETSQHGIEEALAEFEQELTEQNAEAAARELSELSDFVEDLREDLEQHREQQTQLTSQTNAEMSDPAIDSLAAQQESLEQRAQEGLREASELLNTDAIDDLAQEDADREEAEVDNPFEPADEDSGMDDLWEDAGEPERGRHEHDESRQEDSFDSKSKEPLFKPAIDGSKKGFEESSSDEPHAHGNEEAASEEFENWEDVFEPSAEQDAAQESESGNPSQSAPSSSERQSGEPSPEQQSPIDPRARLAQQQQEHAEQLSSATESLAADQQALGELISELSQATNSQQPSSSQSSQQLGQLLNSPAMQQAMEMSQRMDEMQLPPSLARNATAQLAQSQGSPDGARTMNGAVEQILVELGETDPKAASLLMRMQPHQREDLLQGLRQGGPKGYQRFIRDYFIRLSQAGAK